MVWRKRRWEELLSALRVTTLLFLIFPKMYPFLCWIIEVEIYSEQFEWVYNEVQCARQHLPWDLWSEMLIIHCWDVLGNTWIHFILLCLPFFYSILVYSYLLAVNVTEVHQMYKELSEILLTFFFVFFGSIYVLYLIIFFLLLMKLAYIIISVKQVNIKEVHRIGSGK